MKSVKLAVIAALSTFAVSPFVSAEPLIVDEKIIGRSGNDVTEMSCTSNAGRVPKVLSCFYHAKNPVTAHLDIYEIQSTDGGDSFGSPILVTNGPLDSYTPGAYYDSVNNRVFLAYSKNNPGHLGNTLVVKIWDNKTPPPSWYNISEQVVAEGKAKKLGDYYDCPNDSCMDYWEPSILTLHNGEVLIFYVVNGPESAQAQYNNTQPNGSTTGTGYIAVRKSINRGDSFGDEIRVTPKPEPNYTPTPPSKDKSKKIWCDPEWPSAVQNSHGDIQLFFSKYMDAGYIQGSDPYKCTDWDIPNPNPTDTRKYFPASDINYTWSSTHGKSWSPPDTLYHALNNSNMSRPFVMSESETPSDGNVHNWRLLLLASNGSTKPVQVMLASSVDQGSNWTSITSLFPVSQTTWSTWVPIRPTGTVSSNSLFGAYSAGYGACDANGCPMYSRRYKY